VLPAARQNPIAIGGRCMPLLARSVLFAPVVHAGVPGSLRVHVHGVHTDCRVALACALHRRMSSMSTLTAFVPLCVLADASFDLSELTGVGSDAARTRARSHEVEGRDCGLVADASRGPCGGLFSAVRRGVDGAG
jgi:hypothetical protein